MWRGVARVAVDMRRHRRRRSNSIGVAGHGAQSEIAASGSGLQLMAWHRRENINGRSIERKWRQRRGAMAAMQLIGGVKIASS